MSNFTDKQVTMAVANIKLTDANAAKLLEDVYAAYHRLRSRLNDVTQARDYYQRQAEMKTFTGL